MSDTEGEVRAGAVAASSHQGMYRMPSQHYRYTVRYWWVPLAGYVIIVSMVTVVFFRDGRGLGGRGLAMFLTYLFTCRVVSHGAGRASQEASWSGLCSAPSSWLFMMRSRPAHLVALSRLYFRGKFSLLDVSLVVPF